MKTLLRIAAAAVIALSVAGCETTSVLQGGTSILKPITNPLGNNELAALESAYGIASSAAVNYRRLGICRAGTRFTLARPCADRAVVVKLQEHDRKAYAALLAARRFGDSKSINAISAFNAARAAIADFQAALAANGVR